MSPLKFLTILKVLSILLVAVAFAAMSALQHDATRHETVEMVAMGAVSPHHHQNEPARHTATSACLTLCVGASRAPILSLTATDLTYRLFAPARVGEPTVTMIGTPPPERPPQMA